MLGYLFSIAAVASSISLLGLDRTIEVYGAKKENVTSPAYTLGLISCTTASIIVYILTQNISVSILTWGSAIFALNLSDLNSKKLYGTFVKYRILRASLSVILAFALYQIFSIDGLILGFALASLSGLKGVYDYAKNKEFSIGLLKPKVNFMIANWLTRLSGTLFWWGDKIMIGSLLGFSVLGSYQLATQYLFFLNTIPAGLFIYLIPQESQQKKNKKLKFFAFGVSVILFLVSILILPSLIDTFFPDYQESIFPAQIISVAIILITVNIILDTQFLGREMSKIVLIGTGIQTIIYFSLIVLLGTEFGIIGLAFAFLISTIVRTTFLALCTRIY